MRIALNIGRTELSGDREVRIMDDDGNSNSKSTITEEIVFLWDGFTYIYAESPPVDGLEQSHDARQSSS